MMTMMTMMTTTTMTINMTMVTISILSETCIALVPANTATTTAAANATATATAITPTPVSAQTVSIVQGPSKLRGYEIPKRRRRSPYEVPHPTEVCGPPGGDDHEADELFSCSFLCVSQLYYNHNHFFFFAPMADLGPAGCNNQGSQSFLSVCYF